MRQMLWGFLAAGIAVYLIITLMDKSTKNSMVKNITMLLKALERNFAVSRIFSHIMAKQLMKRFD